MAHASLDLFIDGVPFSAWHSYSFNSDFLTPTDAFQMECSQASLTPAERRLILPGKRAELRLDGVPQVTAWIDKITVKTNRNGGSVLSVSGRDTFGAVVDSNMDPRQKFKENMTLEEIVREVFEPFGFDFFFDENSNDRSAKQALRVRTSKKGKPIKKTTIAAQLRPHEGEGCFAFVQRLANRFGLWVWPTSDGLGVVVGTPDFDQEPAGTLVLTDAESATNVESGEATYDITGQPSFIVSEGFGGSNAEFGKSKLRVVMMNPFVELPDNIEKQLEAFKPFTMALYFGNDAGFVDAPVVLGNIRNPVPRPMFLHDTESKTIEQLVRFTRREMSLRTRKFFTWKATIAHHDVDGVIPIVDSVWNVKDTFGDVDEPMWIKGRTLKRSRQAGTSTDIELIRLNTLVF